MLESLNAKVLNVKEASLTKPNELTILEDGADRYDVYTMEKAANKYLYKQLDATMSTSKELYKSNEEFWKQYIDDKLKEKDDKPKPFKFNDENVRYIVDESHNIIDITEMSDDYFEDFKSKLDMFLMEVNSTEHTEEFCFDGVGGLVKLVLYRSKTEMVEQDYTPVVICEINNKRAEYSIYTGILIYKTFTFIPSMNPVATYQSFIDFIFGINILGTLELSENNARGLYDAYLDFTSNNIEISARELIRVLTKAGYKLQLKEDMSLDDIDKLRNEESNITIKNFFNTFKLSTGETAEDILNLSEIKKVFKYNKLTIVDLLKILSNEYLSQDDKAKVNAQILSDLVFGLYTKRIDATDARGIIDDINNR